MKTRLLLLAGVAAAGLHLAASTGNPVGLIEDDSVQILLARSLRHGGFALPDANGVPISDPLPGMAALLMLPVWLVEPDWRPLRAVALLSLAAAVFFTWRLGKRLLPEPWPAAAAGLAALSPVLVRHSGLVLPDIPYLALTLISLDLGTRDGPWTKTAPALLAAGLACLVRPHGAFLCLALAAGLLFSRGWPSGHGKRVEARKRQGILFLACLLPLGLWLLRNKLLSGVSTGYAVNWRTQISLLGEPGAMARHSLGLIRSFFGFGLAGLARPGWLGLTAGSVLACAAGWGCLRLMKDAKHESPLVFSMAAYAILVFGLHLTWQPEDSRYAIPLVPVLWLFIAKACGKKLLLGPALLALAAVTALGRDWDLASASLRRPHSYQPQTMEWLRRNTLPEARIESLKFNTVMLLTGRPSFPPALRLAGPVEWAAASREAGISFVHVEHVFRPGGFVPHGAGDMGRSILAWAQSASGGTPAYRNDSEGASVFALGPILTRPASSP